MNITLTPTHLNIELTTYEKIGGLSADRSIPRADITSAGVDPDPLRTIRSTNSTRDPRAHAPGLDVRSCRCRCQAAATSGGAAAGATGSAAAPRYARAASSRAAASRAVGASARSVRSAGGTEAVSVARST